MKRLLMIVGMALALSIPPVEAQACNGRILRAVGNAGRTIGRVVLAPVRAVRMVRAARSCR